MEEGFDLDNMIDSISLTGQWQPSTLPTVSDSSLDSQILGDFDGCDIFSRLDSSPADEIHHALVDTSSALFNSSSPSESALAAESMTDLFSSFRFELPVQSHIEDSMERMNICQTHTPSAMTASSDSFDLLTSSASAIPMGSSPVEHKEIDNSILARQCVRNQQRLLKSAPKPRRYSGIRATSSSVAPINIVATYNGCQPYATAQNSTEFDEQQKLLQCDAAEWKKISIRCQPRQRFRPRMRAESQDMKHYIRCELGTDSEYPTIDLSQSWARQSVTNIIEVTLVTKNKLPHYYSLENKQCQPFFDGNALIFRENEANTLYYRLTPEDFSKGYKSFMVEHIKEKQGAVITKDLIKTHELEQSMLRFTRIFEEKGAFVRDVSSTAYSCVMTEVYGDVAIDHMGPRFGPMAGNERVYALVKGRANKEDFTVFVQEVLTGWHEQITFTKTGNLLFFAMPRYPSPQRARAVVTITICYQGAELYESNFVYKNALDEELASLNLGESSTATGSSSSRSFDVMDLISATGVRPVAPPGTKRAKRLSAGPRKV